MSHAAISQTLADRIAELGGIAAARIRAIPAPGTAFRARPTRRSLRIWPSRY
jgi:hypothetical protein